MATKLGRVVRYNEELPCINSQDRLITWSIVRQDGDLPLGVSTHKVKQPFTDVVTRGRLTN